MVKYTANRHLGATGRAIWDFCFVLRCTQNFLLVDYFFTKIPSYVQNTLSIMQTHYFENILTLYLECTSTWNTITKYPLALLVLLIICTGPNAVNAEKQFRNPNYYLSISQSKFNFLYSNIFITLSICILCTIFRQSCRPFSMFLTLLLAKISPHIGRNLSQVDLFRMPWHNHLFFASCKIYLYAYIWKHTTRHYCKQERNPTHA